MVIFACACPCFLGLLSVLLFISFLVFCVRARKRPKSEIRHTLHAKTSFFKVRARAGAAPRTTTDGPKRHQIKPQKSEKTPSSIVDFSASRGRPPKYLPKGPPVEPPGISRGPPDGPKRRQERPKTAPRAAKSAPRAVQGRLRSGLGGHLGPAWGLGGPQRPPGGHFGTPGAGGQTGLLETPGK